jgi:hypothetical protein
MLKAKIVMPNKFWILENNIGERQGTVSIQPNLVKVVINNVEKTYDTIDKACWDVAINVNESEPTAAIEDNKELVLGYPSHCQPFNPTWDIKRKIPIFTKTEKSRTLHAAGYYIIKFDTGWAQSFCPKVSTLDLNEYQGPFKDKLEMRERLRKMHNADNIN